ncbi:RimK/LysX family protein [Methylonatrum kenyense]|nr:RimK/LysX family protein [Methylonatrum kenyense]MCK8515462.1 RimK/LysX family protein [Methylonatrum kenyense]
MDILGWIETVQLQAGGFAVDAKLDTGADNSSLNAPEVEEFEKDGDTWVRFTVGNGEDEEATFEKPLHRTARIRSASGTSERPVVKMEICLGNTVREVEVNLADRSGLSYQMLIGRSFMKDHILVDSGSKYTAEPNCGDDDD